MSKANIGVLNNDFERLSDKVILFGSGGVGKSAALATLFIDCPPDRRVIIVATEKNALRGLERGLALYDISLEEGQLIYVLPKKKEKAFSNLKRSVDSYTKQTKSVALQGNKDSTMNKEKYTFLQSILGALEDFSGVDYVTGETVKVGNVGSDLDSSDILVIDGFSPISHEVWNTIVGDKIAISMNDYMPVQHVIYSLASNLASLDCQVIMLAHEKEVTDDKGIVIQHAVDFGCGNAITHKLLGCFTDVIYAYTFGTGYLWAGAKNKVTTVSRVLPKEDNLKPNFSLYRFFGNKGSYIEKTK